MKSLLFFTSLLLMGSPPVSPDYYQLSQKEFFALEDVNRPIDPQHLDKDLLEAAIFYATNEVRADKRKSPFAYRTLLGRTASFHARYLEEEKTVDHLNRKDKKYKTPYDRTLAFGGDLSAVAENLARIPVLALGNGGEFFTDEKGRLVNKQREPLQSLTYAALARTVLDGWMHSKGHRANILNAFQLLGTGVSDISYNKDGIPEIYLVQNFGNP